MSSTSEQWLSAQESSDLGDLGNDGTSAIDLLRASGAVAQRYGTALSVWRLTELDDKLELKRSFDGMIAMAVHMGIKNSPVHAAGAVLAWMLDPLCEHCHGRGFETIAGTPALSDVACVHCEGTPGKRPTEWGDREKALHDRLMSEQREAARAIRRKLGASE